MRWISYAVCIGLLAVQLSYSKPTASKENLSDNKDALQNVNTELQYSSADLSGRHKRTVGVFRRIFPELSKGGEEVNVLSESASESKNVRVPFVQSENDLQTAASGEDSEHAESSQEELSEDINISEGDENSRSKRLGVFGNLFGGGGDSGSEGGSGNFLFDIIRKTADGAARAAGTVYRLVAGTDNSGLSGYSDEEISGPYGYMPFTLAAQTSVTTSVPSSPITDFTGPANTTLVAGSGATEQQDENANVPSDQGHSLDDGYQTGIPGPITRLFVIANRGIANLVQDLILRLAQTSERLVNFKARLITAII